MKPRGKTRRWYEKRRRVLYALLCVLYFVAGAQQGILWWSVVGAFLSGASMSSLLDQVRVDSYRLMYFQRKRTSDSWKRLTHKVQENNRNLLETMDLMRSTIDGYKRLIEGKGPSPPPGVH